MELQLICLDQLKRWLENILRIAFINPINPNKAKNAKPYTLIAKGIHKITNSISYS